MPLISIIVPVYKVEQYLHRCIDSILLQTFTDFELILVDDGSPDNCPAICDEYAHRDSRVRVIHQENGWISSARNAGVAQAVGKYIAFIDSDDWIRPDYLHMLLTNLLEHHADISTVKAQRLSDPDCDEPVLEEKLHILSGRDSVEYICAERDTELKAIWAKLISAEIVRKHPFPTDRHFAEDMAVSYLWFAEADRVVISNQQKYCYFKNNEGMTGKAYGKFRLGNLQTLSEMLVFFQENGFDELYRQYTLSYVVDLCHQHAKVLNYLNDQDVADTLVAELRRVFQKERKNCGLSLKAVPQCYEILYPKAMAVYWKAMGLWNKLNALINRK